jgi:cytochrome c oxidase cbb3-type subunit 3
MRAVLVASVLIVIGSPAALAQQDAASPPAGQPMQPEAPPRSETGVPAIEATPGATAPFSASANLILRVPVSGLHPGNVSFTPKIDNPLAKDPQAATRGMQDFIQFNCVGCHAPNAGGGMGPALSEGHFIYGSSPANLFLSIYQGRPNGMPTWGDILPESTIWELVAYVQGIAHPPSATFGETISRTPPSPAVEQTPAEFLQTANPWSFTTRFSDGKQPVGE